MQARNHLIHVTKIMTQSMNRYGANTTGENDFFSTFLCCTDHYYWYEGVYDKLLVARVFYLNRDQRERKSESVREFFTTRRTFLDGFVKYMLYGGRERLVRKGLTSTQRFFFSECTRNAVIAALHTYIFSLPVVIIIMLPV